MTTNTTKTYDVAVIGGGVIGTSCVYHLVKKGFSVALIEKNNVARGTSSHCDAAALLVDKQPGADAALGYGSIQRFLELQQELSYDFELHQRGCVYVCDTEREFEVAAQYAKDMQADGYNVNASGRRCASTVFIMIVSGLILYLVYGVGARDLGERLERREKRRKRWAKLTGKAGKEMAA